jgi:hypothetical protein
LSAGLVHPNRIWKKGLRLEIRDAGQNHDTIRGRAVITLAKMPDGWRYAAISAQKLPPSGDTTGSRR